jgi:hypothetical protein
MLKTLLALTALLLTPLALPSCCETRTVPVAAPRVPCPFKDPGPLPAAPSASVCGNQVCESPADAADEWLWMRDARRALDLAKACTAGGV